MKKIKNKNKIEKLKDKKIERSERNKKKWKKEW